MLSVLNVKLQSSGRWRHFPWNQDLGTWMSYCLHCFRMPSLTPLQLGCQLYALTVWIKLGSCAFLKESLKEFRRKINEWLHRTSKSFLLWKISNTHKSSKNSRINLLYPLFSSKCFIYISIHFPLHPTGLFWNKSQILYQLTKKFLQI